MKKPVTINSIEEIKSKLSKIDDQGKKSRITRFIISALSSIPWVGGFIGASSAFHSEKEQGKVNDLQKLWLEEHHRKIEELANTIFQIIDKLESSGVDVQDRMETEEYLTLVRKGFKEWDNAETVEKKEYLRKLLTNAAATSLSTDDMIRLFIEWIKNYHETHFMVIKEIYKNKGITRSQIWSNISQSRPAENSVEADLYKLLIRDLSTGGIIRQHRETDYYGNFIKKPSSRRSKSGSSSYKSAFDENDLYELTEMGQRFVHYTMEDVVTQIGE
ncbi:hypothetical protein SAMN05661096_00096 [Marivirga sericea]|uniref:Uncharacterized protein n=1 Tax=Marivirga sericea TaxID=1028 RepID=A0A1X7I2N2_9BACT|nr:hypothetical protein [Marivirga sericea]SMG07936.1 hypothetical protein SAMN05661096_00096 [Marivirga sericea]